LKLATVQTLDGSAVPALVRDDGTTVLLEDAGFADAISLIEAGEEGWQRACAYAGSKDGISTETAVFLPPIPHPSRNVFCLGANYQVHVVEGNRPSGPTMPDVPVIFTKPWTSLRGQDAVVDIADQPSDQVDWEAEIAVVIGKGGKNIAKADAFGHVFGYTLANDLSARDLQLAGGAFSQWFKGKSLDGFCPLGPWITRREDIEDVDAIDVLLTVNGETKQQFVSGDMYFKVDTTIEYLSRGMELLPGDVILTGTSAGVGLHRTPPEFLVDADVVTITSKVLGVLRTTMGSSE
jgi:2-keto-4-pentenoate hydratase/2-oxohepta-3-ene-1,7-dioic acid hydratase in catechol pathway